MTYLNIRIHMRVAAQCIQESLSMWRNLVGTLFLLKQFIFRPIKPPTIDFGQRQVAFGSVNGHAVLATALKIRTPNSLFVGNDSLSTFRVCRERKNDVLRVGELLIVVKKEFSPVTRYPVWMGCDAQGP